MGEGKLEKEPRAEMDGGTGDELREAWQDVTGDMVGVLVVRDRSGLDTELIQQRLDRLDNFRIGSDDSLNWTLRSLTAGGLREGSDTEVEGGSPVYG